MRLLANTLSRDQAMEKLAQETAPRQTISFYRYVIVEDPTLERDHLFKSWSELGVLGRVYISREGINAQINLPKPNVEAFRALIDASPYFSKVPFKFAIEEPAIPFWKLAIKVKKQIVADNLPADSYDI